MHTHHRGSATGLIFALGYACLLVGCAPTDKPERHHQPPLPQAVVDMMEVHGHAAWRELSTIQYASEVDFGGLLYRSQTDLHLHDWDITERVIEPTGFTMSRIAGEVRISQGTPPPDFNPDALINRWPYFLAAPFLIAEENQGLTYLGPVLIDGRLYDAVRVVPDTGDSKCPVDWLIAYITSPGNEVGVGHLAMLRYPVAYPIDEETMLVAENVAVYEPLTRETTPAGSLVMPHQVTFHIWIGEFESDGPEGHPDWEQTIGTVTFHFLGAE